jgi:isopenicillin N synthase-like dioxygenase
MVCQSHTIPSLNLQDFFSPNLHKKVSFIKDVGNALRDFGFFKLTKHPISPDFLSEVYKTSLDFFLLSDEEKRAYENVPGSFNRGFHHFGREHAKDTPYPDLKEFWQMGRPSVQAPKNLWPSQISNFENVISKLYFDLDACSKVILQACALYLELEEDFFISKISKGPSILRLLHYPPIPKEASCKSVRAAAHEDINLITFLCPSTSSGLEILTPEGEWLPIASDPSEIIVDSGDMMQNITNNYFKSTTHRVVNSDLSHERRMSVPFFVHPDNEVDLTPLPYCVEKTSGKVDFPTITAEEYLSKRLKEIGIKKD